MINKRTSDLFYSEEYESALIAFCNMFWNIISPLKAFLEVAAIERTWFESII